MYGAMVHLHVLRRVHKCNLPVEIWHRQEETPTKAFIETMLAMNAIPRNVDEALLETFHEAVRVLCVLY